MEYRAPQRPSVSIPRIQKVKLRHFRSQNNQTYPVLILNAKTNMPIHTITPTHIVPNANEIQRQNSVILIKDNDTDTRSTSSVVENQRKSSLSSQIMPRRENDMKYQTNRNHKCCHDYCCQHCTLCTYFAIIAFIFLAAAIAALTIVFIEPKAVSTTTTSTTTTSSTTTTTTSTTTTSSTTTTTTSSTTTTTTSSTTTTTTTSATTTTTTTARPFVPLLGSGDYLVGVYNTIAGGSTGGVNGMYSGNTEYPQQAIDGLLSTKYLNSGNSSNPGINTGFYIQPTISSATIACSLLFATGNDSPNRDPLIVTLEGTNSAAFDLGSSWTLTIVCKKT